VNRGAVFSECRGYRYTLWREWADGPRIAFVMLNPSTADAEFNDPTVERCERRAERTGYGAIDVVNLFAWRSTDPKVLPYQSDPVGPANDDAIRNVARSASRVVVGWGNTWKKQTRWWATSPTRGRDRAVLAILIDLGVPIYCLGINGDGSPKHPLYLRDSAPYLPFDVSRLRS
jgi:hypothetical protein